MRLVIAAVVFAAMLGLRLGPVPADDDDPVADYGPQLSSVPVDRSAAASAGAEPVETNTSPCAAPFAAAAGTPTQQPYAPATRVVLISCVRSGTPIGACVVQT
jgi:hypothetical protein